MLQWARSPPPSWKGGGEREAMRGRAHHNLTQVNHQLGGRDGFREHLERTEQVLGSVKLTEDLFNLFDGVTNLLLQTGDKEDLEMAVDSGHKCLEMSRKVRSADSLARVFYNIAKVRLFIEEFEEGMELMLSARKVDSSSDISLLILHNHKMVSVVLKAHARVVERSEKEQSGTHEPMETVGDSLCKFKGSQGERRQVPRLAVGYYERALSKASNKGNTDVLSSLNNSVAETYKDLEEYDSALYFFEKQLAMEEGRHKG